MFVAVSSDCFSHLSLKTNELIDKSTEIGFSAVELVVGEGKMLSHNDVVDRRESLTRSFRTSRRLAPVALFLATEPTAPHYREVFRHCCDLAREMMTVVVVVRPSIGGIPFNDEVDRLRDLVRIANSQGVAVGITTERSRISETPDTVVSLCKAVPGMGVSLDTSHYIYDYPKPRDYDSLMEYVCHLRIRDTTPKLFQTQVGQGKLEYGKLMIQLKKHGYDRAMCADLVPLPELDPVAEMRKMRLLLESLL